MAVKGTRVAIAGMGVSGLALGKAVLVLGGRPTVFDQKPNDSPALISAVDELDAAGVDAVTGWHGRLDPSEFDLLVVSPGFPRQHPAIRDMLHGGRPVWSEVEFAYRAARAPILAVTGTNGKSTTTVMLWTLLNGAGKTAHLCGNIAGSGYPEQTLTEAALKAEPTDLLVAEVSSYQLEWVESFRPRVAGVTNVTPDHMDRYASFDDYYDTKMRVFHGLGEGDWAVVNLDEPSTPFERVRREVPSSAPVVGFSPSGTVGHPGKTHRHGGRLLLSGLETSLDELPLYGEHNVTNALMAWEMGSCVADLGRGSLEALKGFRGLNNRMERLGSRDGVLVVNNSMCTNPAAVVASSRSVAGRQHILMGGLTKNLDFRPVGDYARQAGHSLIVFGPEPEHMVEMLGSVDGVEDDLEGAFHSAVVAARPGEVVLLAPGCASAEPYANFKERGDAFRAMARAWLDGGGAP